MKIPTANVLVAFNQETMDRLFAEGATYKSLVSGLTASGNDGLLFDNVANPNFISFEHSLGLGGGMKMTLTFIDPKDEFEKRFFKTNPARLIKGFSNPIAEKTTSFVTAKPDDVEQSQAEYDKEYVAAYKKELEKSIGERKIYIAYGTGNNLSLWSGPHRTILTNATIDIKGAKKITLTLTPTTNSVDIGTRRGVYNEEATINLDGLKMRYAGESQPLDFLKDKAYDPTEFIEGAQQRSVISQYNDIAIKALAEGGFESLSKKIEKFDFHTMVVDAIRSYVQKATSNKNVIIVLPNINLVCRQAINDEAKKVDTLQTAQFANIAAAGLTALFGNFKKARSLDLNNSLFTNLGKEEMFVEGLLKGFGLRLHSALKEEAGKLEKPVKANGDLGTMVANEKHPIAEDALRSFYKDRYFTAVIDKTEKTIPDHKQVLKTVFDKIKQKSKESYSMSDLAIMTETDINVLKLWGSTKRGSWSKYYPLAGYDDFTEDSPAVIVGDLALIKEYLYGGIDVEQKLSNIKSLKSTGKQYKDNLGAAAQATQGLGLIGAAFGGAAKSSSQAYEIAAASEIPLHPVDRVLLANKEYNRKIRAIVYPPVDGDGSFGNVSYIPDDFAYNDKQFTDEEKKYIDENGIPIFRYNTQNPNILDMKFNFGGIYFSLLKTGFQKEISRLTSAVAEGVLPTGIGTFPIRERGAAIAYLRTKGFSQGMGDEDKKEVLKSLAGRISKELAEELEVDSAEAAADSLAAIVEDAEKNNLKGLVLVDQELPGNPNSIMADFTENLYRKALQMSITTLPTFHISRLAHINGPCIVFAQDQPISQSIRRDRSLMNKFFSGLYKIMGFKHTITTSAATSEFKLVKNAPSFKKEED